MSRPTMIEHHSPASPKTDGLKLKGGRAFSFVLTAKDSPTTEENRLVLRRYWNNACPGCTITSLVRGWSAKTVPLSRASFACCLPMALLSRRGRGLDADTGEGDGCLRSSTMLERRR